MSALATTSADVGAASHKPTATEVSGFHTMAATAEPLVIPPPPLIQPQLQSAQFPQVGSMPPTMLGFGCFQELPIPAPPQNVVAASQSHWEHISKEFVTSCCIAVAPGYGRYPTWPAASLSSLPPPRARYTVAAPQSLWEHIGKEFIQGKEGIPQDQQRLTIVAL